MPIGTSVLDHRPTNRWTEVRWVRILQLDSLNRGLNFWRAGQVLCDSLNVLERSH